MSPERMMIRASVLGRFPLRRNTILRALAGYLDELKEMAEAAGELRRGHVYRQSIAAEMAEVRRAIRDERARRYDERQPRAELLATPYGWSERVAQ